MEVQAKDFFDHVCYQLTSVTEPAEAKAISFLLLEELVGLSKMDLILNRTIVLHNPEQLEAAVKRLQNHEPIQHVLGFAWFMERKFEVNQNVLIPRQETEELVHMMLDQISGKNLTVLDIGTGSGIIPICLKLTRPDLDITGLDVSSDALAVAKKNAEKHQVSIRWIEMDILKSGPNESYDIIVSNPPYIKESERVGMSKNVLDFDPGLALFVPDHDPLLFYRRIVAYAHNHLLPDGKLYFEINERLGKETAELVKNHGLNEVMIHQDLNGKDRMISARLAI